MPGTDIQLNLGDVTCYIKSRSYEMNMYYGNLIIGIVVDETNKYNRPTITDQTMLYIVNPTENYRIILNPLRQSTIEYWNHSGKRVSKDVLAQIKENELLNSLFDTTLIEFVNTLPRRKTNRTRLDELMYRMINMVIADNQFFMRLPKPEIFDECVSALIPVLREPFKSHFELKK